jgi:hypothetical protein
MERDKDLTGGDLAVGEESMKKNLGMRDLSGFMEEYKQKYKSENEEIDWARITNFGLMGGLFGSTLATLYWNKDASSKSYFFWGLMLGSCASAFLMWSFLVYRQLQQEGSSKYERDMAAKKEALRRKEQETFERHDEFVYYDAATPPASGCSAARTTAKSRRSASCTRSKLRFPPGSAAAALAAPLSISRRCWRGRGRSACSRWT